MLPPPPTSRKSSYAYSHPTRQASYLSQGSFRLASQHRKASGSTRRRTSGEEETSEDEEDEALRRELEIEDEEQAERGLEETLERLGFGYYCCQRVRRLIREGAYHWRLLALCGFGWMSDNSALQCIAVILPRVQIHYDLSSQVVGLLSASTMAGMMIGAVGWGTISDMLGRSLPFNSTLFLTAVFGIGASFAPNFTILCVWMFMLGSAVGGSMPTDGTLFLENLPHSKQYLLTLLSVFFSLGAVLSSVVSYIYLPGSSCSQYDGCDIAGGSNDGWRRVLFVLGLINLGCAVARWSLLRLHESPRYLVTTGREQEAVVALRAIATFNSHSLDIQRADVALSDSSYVRNRDKKASELSSPSGLGLTGTETDELSPRRDPLGHPINTRPSSDPLHSDETSRPPSRTRYDAVGLGPSPPLKRQPIRMGSAFYTAEIPSPDVATDVDGNRFEESFSKAQVRDHDHDVGTELGDEEEALVEGKPGTKRMSSVAAAGKGWRLRERLEGWWMSWKEQMAKLFVPQWRRTVLLMWVIWGSMSFSYTMFNVWLPAVLESRAEGEGDEAIRSALKEFVLYSMAGCPGSIIGAWMIQTSLGRRRSLAICTVVTGIATFAFINVTSHLAVTISSMMISMSATAMYAVLYGMTPETFGTAIRGTACGTSAALSRLTGVMAPVSAGFLLTISPSLPVFASASILFITAGCSLALPFERVAERGGGAVMAH